MEIKPIYEKLGMLAISLGSAAILAYGGYQLGCQHTAQRYEKSVIGIPREAPERPMYTPKGRIDQAPFIIPLPEKKDQTKKSPIMFI